MLCIYELSLIGYVAFILWVLVSEVRNIEYIFIFGKNLMKLVPRSSGNITSAKAQGCVIRTTEHIIFVIRKNNEWI